MKRCAAGIFGLVVLVSPAVADATYVAAVDTMLEYTAAPDLDEGTNHAVVACYLNRMTQDQLQQVAGAGTANELFSVLVEVPMEAVDCENAIVSEALGVEFSRP